MKTWSAQNFPTDEPQDSPARQQGRASWYAQGLSDAVGDRLLMFDNSGASSLELLRFSPKVVASPEFESALRERVDLLSQFRHPSFAKVRAVEKLEPKNDLTLVSNYVSGKRLSEGLAALRGPAFAMWLIRDLVPALASLQQHGRGVAHGALTTDRVVLTSEGRLVIVEHVLGSALERLRLSPTEMWVRFGIASPPTAGAVATLDCQTDVFQLGMVALSVLLGRSIASYEYPDHLGELLDQFQQTAGRELPSSLRSWLSRALHVAGKPFESARDAQDGLAELDGAPTGAELPVDGLGVSDAAPRTAAAPRGAAQPEGARRASQPSVD
jgi:serine/threonine protein kinase